MIHKIKGLYDEGRGLSKRKIARQLGISRTTVCKYLRMKEEEIQLQQEDFSRVKLLDVYRDYLIHLLETFPSLSGVKVLRKLQGKYPDMSISGRSVRRYIRKLKETVSFKQARYYEPVLDMVPGVQCQVDGGELRGVLIDGVETVIYFVVFVLSYSRLMHVGLSREPVNTDRFIGMHDAAFRYFGGRPEECVYDQSKLVVIHEQYRELEVNQRFHAYATAAGFRIHACKGYDPESKGKVEAGVKYVKINALYGETFEDWQGLEIYMADWLDNTANVRIHGSTGETPGGRYKRDERQHMGPYLTPTVLAINFTETRKVDKTGLISWRSNKYSVPMQWQQAMVGVREEDLQLVISDLETRKEVARHGISHDRGIIIKNKDHYRNKQEQIAELEADIQQKIGDREGKQICQLLHQTNSRIYKDQLVGLKGLLKRFEMPPVLRSKLCDRPALSTSQIRDYLEAYYARPERFGQSQTPDMSQDKPVPNPLTQYVGIAQQHKEVGHDQLH